MMLPIRLPITLPITFPIALPAPAKLNLCLLIVGRRADGYHNLQTAFQLLSLHDELLFEALDKDAADELVVAGMPEVSAKDNLVYQAAILLCDHCRVLPRVKITVKKRIPMGAGLGGGSSDAATVLVALNALLGCNLPVAELAALGSQLGADVPVFVHGASAWGEGIGEALTPLKMPEATYLLVYPNCHVSTKAVFNHPDLTRDSSTITIARFLSLGASNDCERIVCQIYPEVSAALDWLNQWGPAKMTGTGSCIFLRCESPSEANAIQKEVPSKWQSFVAQGVDRSPLSALFS
ncbi:MAG: 4-diphosphocytidyl-2-C-methyl-D-erythritol kinase [Candidatus Azotimanducaceae bacterium]|jgi:4-diphosphocytidyl-2-C-methyl-D-erythritol kinase